MEGMGRRTRCTLSRGNGQWEAGQRLSDKWFNGCVCLSVIGAELKARRDKEESSDTGQIETVGGKLLKRLWVRDLLSHWLALIPSSYTVTPGSKEGSGENCLFFLRL